MLRNLLKINLFVWCLVGCQTIQQPLKTPLYQYRADIQISTEDHSDAWDGIGVTNKLEQEIGIESKAPLNYLRISSCARDNVIQNVDKNWFGGVGHEYHYPFKANRYESTGACPLYIEAVGKNGVAAWGYLFFRTNEKLPATMDCNGSHWSFKDGASVCQTKSGTRQEIFFSKPVKYEASSLCEISPDPTAPNAYIVATSEVGFCYATFTDGVDFHRMVLLGYDQVLVRDE